MNRIATGKSQAGGSALCATVAAALCLLAATASGVDFNVQQGSATIPAGTNVVTLTAGVDYTAPATLSNAFIRIVNTRLMGGGRTDAPTTQQNSEDLGVTVNNPSNLLSSITFRRYGANATRNCGITWEIIEYTALEGGGNEMIVRDQGEILNANGASQTTGTPVAGVADTNDLVVFITGQRHDAAGRTGDRMIHVADWLGGTAQPRFTRGDSAGNSRVSYAVVEFTGDHWKVQRIQHEMTGTAVETEPIPDPVGSIDRVFFHVQVNSDDNGLDDVGIEAWLSDTDEISFQVQANRAQTGVVWVVENTLTNADVAMQVRHLSGTRGSNNGVADSWTNTFAAVSATNEASVMGECARSSGGGDFYPRGWINLRLISTNEVALWTSEAGQTQNYRFDVVQWPGTPNLPPASPTLYDIPFDNAEIFDTTPEFEFTASDPDGGADLVYQIQWDTNRNFSTANTQSSGSDPGFVNMTNGVDTDPFDEDARIRFTIQPGDELTDSAADQAYYWRVRALDDAGDGGSGIYGEWSDTHSFRVDTSLTEVQWSQTADDQFASDALNGTVTNGSGSVIIATLGTFTTPGSTILNIPAGVTSIRVKAWGAGGGGGAGGSNYEGGDGGGGAYAEAALSVTPGETLTVHVGGGGGGGTFDATGGDGGGGGGRSALLRTGTPLVVAAGGGGGGGGDNSNANTDSNGGAGGTHAGVAGGNASANTTGGGGGDQSSGGSAGQSNNTDGEAGSLGQGGGGGGGNTGATGDRAPSNAGTTNGGNAGEGQAGYGSGGGGGSGYYGGGGGGGATANQAGGGGGGGGSSYVTGTQTNRIAGSGTTPANTSDADYVGGIGSGGGGGNDDEDGTAGSNGLVIVTYAITEVTSTPIEREWAPLDAFWETLTFSDNETGGDVRYDIQYWTGSAWEGTTLTNLDSSPVDLSTNLVYGTHDRIRIRARFNGGGAVRLNSWTLTWDDGPEMMISGKGIEIPDGATSTSTNDNTHFGRTVSGSGSITKTFRIDNDGYVPLYLTNSPRVTLSGSTDFSVSVQPPFPSLFGGGDMNFNVQFTPTVGGIATATVSILNTDLDEDPYTYTITATGVIPPVITNLAPTFVTIDSARLNGELLNSGYEDALVTVYWGTNDGGSTASAWMTNAPLGALGDGTFYTNITGLLSGTEYFYRCYAANSAGEDWVSVSTNFITGITTTQPTVVNLGPIDIWTNSATVRGDLLSAGGDNPDVYLYWGPSNGGTNASSWLYTNYFGVLGVQPFQTNLTDLTPGQTYYYRTFATNEMGGDWAPSTTNFTTLNLPGVATLTAVDVIEDGATLRASVTSTGASPTTVTLYYGTVNGGTNAGSWAASTNLGVVGVGTFSEPVENLLDATTYYVRAYAENADGGVWADETKVFTTLTLGGATIVQTFYIPIEEGDAFTAWSDIAGVYGPVDTEWKSIVSVVVGVDDTIIYYDHWEDGYEDTPFGTNQTTTEIWGDGDPSNGQPPGATNDILTAGQVIALESDVPTPRDSGTQYYDAKDRLTANKPVGVTRGLWPLDEGGFMAGAVQVMDTTQYGIYYQAPIGEDIVYGDDIFEYVGLTVMAADDPTMVMIDIDGDGIDDVEIWLRQGESYFVDGGIQSGATVRSAKPVQAHLITGFESNYATRLFTLFPRYMWADEYVSVVGDNGADEITVWLYNPDTNSAITVVYENQLATGQVVVAADSYGSYTVPGPTGGRYYTTNGAEFIAVSTIGDDSARDWGYALVPTRTLTTMVVCPWGWGSMLRSQNEAPVFVTALTNTTLYVDFDGDPTTGSTNDSLGNLCDQVIDISAYEQVRLLNAATNDQTRLRVYTTDGVNIAAAWGENPDPSTPAGAFDPPNDDDRALDMGATLMPYPAVFAAKSSELSIDVNTNGLADPGDTILYTIRVVNYSFSDARNVLIVDEIPDHTTYVPGSTVSNSYPIADAASGTPYLLDEEGFNIGTIERRRDREVSYELLIDDPFPDDQEIIVNQMYVSSSEGQRMDVEPIRIRKPGLRIVKSVVPDVTAEPGDTVSYSIMVENTGTVTQANIQLYDQLPAGLTYVTNTSEILFSTNAEHFTVADEFESVSYGNNDGTTNWLTDWIEIGETNGPSMDYVVVSNSLGISGSGRGVYRTFNGLDAANAILSLTYRRVVASQSNEYATVDVSSDGSGWSSLGTISFEESDPTNGVRWVQDVSGFLSTNMALRLRTGGTGWDPGNEWIYFDSIEVDFLRPGSGIVTNTGTAPPIMADDYILLPGEVMFVRFDVTVGEPYESTEAVNTAYVVSDKQLDPLYAIATNEIAVITLGDYTWIDTDGDGIQDPGEPPATNVTVRLRDASSNLLETAVTDMNGFYSFTGYRSGDYIIEVVAPTNYLYTAPGGGTNTAFDSNVDTNTGYSTTISIPKGGTNNTIDAGFYQLGSIGDRVWRDDNQNGIQDNGETNSFAGLTVTLYDADTNVVTTTLTDAAGTYLFTNVVPGDYIIGIEEPAEYDFTLQNQGANDGKDSDPHPVTGLTDIVLVESGTSNLTVDAGFYAQPSTIGDRVWLDENDDGIQDPTETNGIAGVTVTLYDDATNLIDTTTTDADGNYSFEDLLPGDYFINFSSPTGYSYVLQDQTTEDADSDPDPATGNTPTFSLGSATNDTSWDAGFYAPPSSIGGQAWFDLSQDGIQDGGTESGAVDVVISLFDAGDTFLGSNLTDSSGFYSFTNLTPGIYYLEVEIPIGYTLSLPDQTTDDADSDFDKVTRQTIAFYLPPGTNYNIWDVGLIAPDDGLAITKASSATGPLSGGDRITYTITVNNTGSVAHAGVTVTDILPPGVTYFPGSVTVIHPDDVTGNMRDSFDAVGYDNSNGSDAWLGDWQEEGESDTANLGVVRVETVAAHNYALNIHDATAAADGYGASRTADLAGEQRATLSYNYMRYLYDADEFLRVYASSNGGTAWTQIAWHEGDGTDDGNLNASNVVDITSFIATNTAIRFYADGMDVNEGFAVDNVDITFGTAPGPGAPGAPTMLASGYVLDAGEEMTVRLMATVDTDPASTQLVNTAYAFGDTHPSISAVVTDTVEIVDLGVTKVVSDPFPGNNELIYFTITVTNSGPSDATRVVLEDYWPSEMIYTNHGTSVGTYNSETRLWSGFDLNAGESATLVITGRVNVVDEDTEITNTIEIVSMDQFDTVSANNISFDAAATDVFMERFEAFAGAGRVRIEWQTASEIGTIGFFLYRKDTESDYVRVGPGLMPSVIGSRAGGSYAYIDDQADPTRNYTYRLVEAEADGTRNICGTASYAGTLKAGKATTALHAPLDPASRFTFEARDSDRRQARVAHRKAWLKERERNRPSRRAPSTDHPTPARLGARPSVDTGDDAYARGMRTVGRRVYLAWRPPRDVAATGTRPVVEIRLGANGSISGWSLTQSSGSPSIDGSVRRAMESIDRIPGLDQAFIRDNPTVTVSFGVK